MDTMTSIRPYQDVLAINDLSDLEIFETRRRRRLAERERERHEKMGLRWIEENGTQEVDSENGGLFRKRLVGGNEPAGKSSTGQLDANVYATKKTIAQGLLDVALLTANASQLKYLLQVGKEHEFYYVMMTLISLSIILQMCLGTVLIMKGRCDINDACQHCRAELMNNIAVWLVYASTVIHVFLSVFHIHPAEQLHFSKYAPYHNASTTPKDSS